MMAELRRAMEAGCPINIYPFKTRSAVAERGDIRMLEWMGFNGAQRDIPRLCAHAARGGHLRVIEADVDCRGAFHHWIGTKICPYAAAGGHLDILQWARKHGAPWE